MAEQRLATLGRAATELRGANQQLRGALDEQRAAVAARPPPAREAADTRLMSKPRNSGGKDDDWPFWSTTTRAYAGGISERLLFSNGRG